MFFHLKVLCVGHIIGAIVAEPKLQAQIAAKLVKVVYEEKPALLTIEVCLVCSIPDKQEVSICGTISTLSNFNFCYIQKVANSMSNQPEFVQVAEPKNFRKFVDCTLSQQNHCV